MSSPLGDQLFEHCRQMNEQAAIKIQRDRLQIENQQMKLVLRTLIESRVNLMDFFDALDAAKTLLTRLK